MNLSNLETVGEKIEAFGGMTDTKARRVSNTAPDQKANITAKDIEAGDITIEMLEALNTPVYLYQTQATIHGLVDGVHSGYDALRYKSIIRNANGSTGVKYIGIDAQKKKHINRMITAWYSEHKAFVQITSQAFKIARSYGSFDSTQKAKYLEAVEKAKVDLEAMPKCFYGSAMIAQVNNYGYLSLYIIADLGAVYQKDVDTVIEWWTGHTEAETLQHMEDEKAQQAKDREAYAIKLDEQRKEGEAKKAEAQAKLLDSVKDNPPTGYQGEGAYSYKIIEWTSMTEYHVKEGTIIFTKGSKGMNVTTGVTGEKTKTYAFDKVEDIFKRSTRLLWKQEEETKPAHSTLVGTNATMTENTEKGGVELRFTGKPTEVILQALKSNGFRWSNYGKFWYAKTNPKTLDFAKSIAS
jgi:hypothetical protein